MIWLSLCVGYPIFWSGYNFLVDPLKRDLQRTQFSLSFNGKDELWCLEPVFVIACDNQENEAENESS